MWSLITGASSGIGRDMARYLYKEYNSNLILVARNEESLNSLKQELELREKNVDELNMDMGNIKIGINWSWTQNAYFYILLILFNFFINRP